MGELAANVGISKAAATALYEKLSDEKREGEVKALFADVSYLAMAELFGGPLRTEFSRSLTKARVQQYQRYFADADRVMDLETRIVWCMVALTTAAACVSRLR